MEIEKAKYELWNDIEKLTLLQAAYLWCGDEPPADELKEPPAALNKARRHMHLRVPHKYRFKPKRLPQAVSIILKQLIDAVVGGCLHLKDHNEGDKLPYGISKDFRISPDSINMYSDIYVLRSELRRYAEGHGKQPVFLFPEGLLNKKDKTEIMTDLMPGIELIWKSIMKTPFSERDARSHEEKMELWKHAALDTRLKIESEYPLLKKEFFPDSLFDLNTSTSKQRREFIGKLLRAILIDQGIEGCGDYEKVYAEYRYLKKRTEQTSP